MALGSVPIEKVESAVACIEGYFETVLLVGIWPFEVCLEKSGETSLLIAFYISSVVRPGGFND